MLVVHVESTHQTWLQLHAVSVLARRVYKVVYLKWSEQREGKHEPVFCICKNKRVIYMIYNHIHGGVCSWRLTRI